MRFDDDARVARLQTALDTSRPGASRAEASHEERLVERLGVIIARIRALTQELSGGRESNPDAIDILTSRMLLHAMSEALATCRELTGPAREHILTSLETVRQGTRIVERQIQRTRSSRSESNSDHV